MNIWLEMNTLDVVLRSEFGLNEKGEVVLGDEMLTPDSSRFWPVEGYEPGHSQISASSLQSIKMKSLNMGHCGL